MPKERRGKIVHPNSRKAKLMVREKIYHDARVQKKLEAKKERSAEFEIVTFIHQRIKDGKNLTYKYKQGFFFSSNYHCDPMMNCYRSGNGLRLSS